MEIEKNIAFFIQSHFPAIYRENGAELVQLVEDYYRFLETQENQSVYVSRRYFDYKDINTTLTKMLVFFQKKFLADLPLKEDVLRFIVKNILDLYRRKGTPAGIQLFFALFYREYDVEIYYPSKQMLKVSNAKWRRGVYLQMFPNDNSFVSKTGKEYTYQDLLGKNITGSASQAKAAVAKINFIILNNILTPIIYIDEVQGTFEKFDDLIVNINGEVVAFGRVNGSLNAIDIDENYKGTTGNEVGDIYNVVSPYGGGGKAIVTEISEQFTGQISYEVENGGYGYTIENTRLLVSNQILLLDNSAQDFVIYERLQDSAGNEGIVIGQNENAVGVRLNPGESFNLSRPISTLDRSPNITFPVGAGGLLAITVKNETSPGPLFPDTGDANNVIVESLDNVANVDVITDVVSPFVSTLINAADYESTAPMSGTASPVNLTTPLDQAFDIQTLTIGSIVGFANIDPGEDYVNDVFAVAQDSVFSNFERLNQILNLDSPAAAGSFNVGEIISEVGTSVTGVVVSTDTEKGFIIVTPFDYYGFTGNDIARENDDEFNITSIGVDYSSRPFGENAVINSTTEFAIGRIKSVGILNSGLGYVDGERASLTNDDGDVQAEGIISADTQGVTSGFWADYSSHLNGYVETANGSLSYYDSGMKIQDSDFYQEYSYQIKSTLNPLEYDKLLKENVHLAGTKMFGDFTYKVKVGPSMKARFIRFFNDDGRGTPLELANTSALTADVFNYYSDSDQVTADNVRTIII
jgi:hypothetical protein